MVLIEEVGFWSGLTAMAIDYKKLIYTFCTLYGMLFKYILTLRKAQLVICPAIITNCNSPISRKTVYARLQRKWHIQLREVFELCKKS